VFDAGAGKSESSLRRFLDARQEATMDDYGQYPVSRNARGRFARTEGARRSPKQRSLAELRPLVRQGHYRIARHAVRHASCEGFTERDIVATVLYGRELMRYPLDERLLGLGWLPGSAAVKIPLHVVLEYRKQRWVDVVTAFIPENPHRVISRVRLAEALRYDGHEPEVRLIGPDDRSQNS
jgi:hypothetical protein